MCVCACVRVSISGEKLKHIIKFTFDLFDVQTTKQSPPSTEDTSFFSTTEGIVILALLAAIVLLLFLMVPVLYVTLRKCGVIKM